MKTKTCNDRRELGVADEVQTSGGRLWPGFDIVQLMSNLYYAEDIHFINFLKGGIK